MARKSPGHAAAGTWPQIFHTSPMFLPHHCSPWLGSCQNQANTMINASGKEPACQGRRLKRHRIHPWVRKIPWRRKWQPTPVFLPGKFLGQRSLAGYHPRGCRRVRYDWVHTHTHKHTHTHTQVDKLSKNFCNLTRLSKQKSSLVLTRQPRFESIDWREERCKRWAWYSVGFPCQDIFWTGLIRARS